MYRKTATLILILQATASLAVILFGVAYGVRCLLAGQLFCATSFAALGYVSGYRLMLLPSLRELRAHGLKTCRR